MIPARSPKHFVRPIGQDAAPHRYAIGQKVWLKDSFGRLLKRQNTFRVTAELPSSAGSPQYRIRSESEVHERIATETNLLPATDKIGEGSSPSSLAQFHFTEVQVS